MDLEKRIQQLASELAPTTEQHARVRSILERRIQGPAILSEAKTQSSPDAQQKNHLREQISDRISMPGVSSVFGRIHAFLSPTSSVQARIKRSVFDHLIPPTPVPFFQRVTKWGAAFVIVALALRASPFLFLAPQSNAVSAVILDPTPTGVELSSHGLWQPVTQEVELHEAMNLRTADGEATLMMHDDGNVRLDAHTTIALNDVSDQPSTQLDAPTFTVESGTVWLQALLPDQVRGFLVATPAGTITMHGGSVSVAVEGTTVRIEVWDRHAVVVHEGQAASLVAGEFVELTPGSKLVVQDLPINAYKGTWVAQNLGRDSVHQRELAQLQQERRAAEAGILPTSPFYTVKRVAETVDVLLTLDPAAKVEKRLQQASIRLNEAAALIIQGDSGASIPLDEYRQTLIDVASGTGDTLVQYLVQRTVAENAAQLSAALPDDQLYILKKAVLQASAALPNDTLDERDVSGTLLVDTLNMLEQAIQNNDVDQMHLALKTLSPYLPSLQSGSGDLLKPDARKEALSLLTQVATALKQTTNGSGTVLTDDIARQIADYLPTPAASADADTPRIVISSSYTPLTESQLETAVQGALRRVFDIYTMPNSRLNALRVEIKKFADSPDEGRFLRRLYRDMPDNDVFRQVVRTAIQNLRVEQFIEDESVETGSGTGAQ
ncbi:DUF5667 domain-containing protein [Candidatus Peribacteria bacterium]|nr:MAG: DUF5667 domain-containing protein [Candidatus Peribacteria bacterium]